MNTWTTEQLLEFHKIKCDKAREIMRVKNHDYAGADGGDPFANFKASTAITGDHPVTGLLIRMVDKLRRISTFIKSGNLLVPGESVHDAFDDTLNYTILGDAILLEQAGITFDEWKENHAP